MKSTIKKSNHDKKNDVPCGQSCNKCKSCHHIPHVADDTYEDDIADDEDDRFDVGSESFDACGEVVSPGGFGPLWGPF